jgi:5'-nucleotidase
MPKARSRGSGASDRAVCQAAGRRQTGAKLMPASLEGQLVVALSSRALFDFEEENRVFEDQDDSAYMRLQLERMEQPARPGVAFPLVQKLLAFNTPERQRVAVVILSRNDPVSGLRIFKSADAAGLQLERGVFTRGRPPFHYLKPLGANLFLSANEADVRAALEGGFPAARVYSSSLTEAEQHPQEVRIAFDGDAVLFSDEAERVFQEQGLAAFQDHEERRALHPLPPGPFMPLLAALHRLRADSAGCPMKIRTALVTARSAPAHERAIRTLMEWKVEVDEAMFLGGLEKSRFLSEFEPDFFFDDQTRHCEPASRLVPTGHVVSGVANRKSLAADHSLCFRACRVRLFCITHAKHQKSMRAIAMTTLTVTSRGQVTFRKEVLQHLGIKPGDKIELDLLPDGRGVLKVARPAGTIDSFVGLLAGQSKKVATIEEINAAAARAWAGKK